MLALLSTIDPGWARLRGAAHTAGAALATLLTFAVLVPLVHPPGSAAIIGVVVSILTARHLRTASTRRRLSALVTVPVTTGLLALLGTVLVAHPSLGEALFVAAVFTTSYLRRFGGRVAHAGRLALAPLVGMFIAPVPIHAHVPQPFLWTALVGGIAVVWVCTMQVFILPDRPDRALVAACDAFRHAARRVVAGLRRGEPERRLARRLTLVNQAALTVDDLLERLEYWDGGEADARLRLATFHAEVAVERAVLAGAGPAVTEAAEAADVVPAAGRATREAITGRPTHAPQDRQAPRTNPARRVQVTTRLALQLGTAMAAAFVLGRLLFPERWNWTVVTAFVVCVGARSRGDVVYKSGQRIVGAVTGALSATLAAHLTSGRPELAVAVILGYLVLGLYLREFGYVYWAFCVASILAVLYGMHGDSGSALLVQRPEEILLGSACGIAAAWTVLPVRTEAMVRRRLATGLLSLHQVLEELHGVLRASESHGREPGGQGACGRAPDGRGAGRAVPDGRGGPGPGPRRPGDPGPLLRAARGFDHDVRELATVLGPVRAHRTVAALVGRPGHAADRSEALGRCPAAVRELVDHATRPTPGSTPPPGTPSPGGTPFPGSAPLPEHGLPTGNTASPGGHAPSPSGGPAAGPGRTADTALAAAVRGTAKRATSARRAMARPLTGPRVTPSAAPAAGTAPDGAEGPRLALHRIDTALAHFG